MPIITVDELSESNNSFTKEFYIYEDEARPAYPTDFSIVNVANQKLYASTSDAASSTKDYVMEIDTTILFNSPLKISKTVNQAGGIIKFDPGISYTNNTVYYWRVSLKPSSGAASDYHWNGSSFIYLSGSSEGSNQSHYYQQLYSDTQHIHLDSSSRKWRFATIDNFLESRNGVFPTASAAASDCTAGINGVNFTSGICPNGTNNVLIFNVVDPSTLKNWQNTLNQPGLSGSLSTCIPSRQANFTYNVSTQAGRKSAMDFLDSIPDNAFVFVRNITSPDSSKDVFAGQWAADTATFGAGNSLYHRLKSQGFVLIDSFYRPRAFSFIYQKNNPEFGPGFNFTNGISDVVDYRKAFTTADTLGFITSPKFGPAVSWKEMHWRGTSLETNSPDNPTVQVIGIDTSGNKTTLFNVDKSQQDLDISSVKCS